MSIRKAIPFLVLGLFAAFHINAQGCNGQRYLDELFTVDITPAVKFGEGVQPLPFNPNATQELFMDIYEPAGDTLARRPLIIWAFGGAFVFGSRLSPDIVTLSNAFTRRGYVNASIDYRLSPDLVINSSPENAYEAIMKGSHDLAAAVRFFYKDAATVDNYRIDTTRIFVGGVSAGAFAALHAVHLDELNEVPVEIYNLFLANGAFEGNSGNQGYSQDVAGVINLCGALGDTAWIDRIGTPIVSVHGDGDAVMPYGSQINTLFGINLMTHGSGSIHPKLDQLGTPNALYTFPGAGHTPFVSSPAYMDTTIGFVRDFLYNVVCGTATSLDQQVPDEEPSVRVFPNPNDGQFTIEINAAETGNLQLSLFDPLGRKIQSLEKITGGLHHIDLPNLRPGVYLLRMEGTPSGRAVYQRVVVR